MRLNPDIFKAYDVRGVYPGEINEDGRARDRRGVRRVPEGDAHRASAATCASRRRRSRRRSSTGATSQGADVVDYGMIATDMLYFAVATRRPRRRRADHGVAQPEAVQRHEAGPRGRVPAERRRGHRRHPRHDRGRRAAAAGRRARGTVTTKNVLDALRRPRDVVHRSVGHQAVQRRPRRRQRHGRPRRAEAVRPAALPDDAAVLRDRRPLSQPRGQPAHRGEPPRHRRARDRGEGRHRHRVGRRRRPLLLHRRHRRVHLRATSSRRCSPRRSC